MKTTPAQLAASAAALIAGTVALTEKERGVLSSLRFFSDEADRLDWHRKWARPMDVGGFNRSHHGNTLRRLLRKGLVEADIWRIGSRRTFKYRISEAGRVAVERKEINP